MDDQNNTEAPASQTEAASPAAEPSIFSTAAVSEMSPEDKAAAEKKALRERAKMMGLNPSPNASAETLRAQIQAKIDGDTPAAPAPVVAEATVQDTANPANPLDPLSNVEASVQGNSGGTGEAAPAVKPRSARAIALADAMRLIRVKITNLDPKKKDLPGEIFTVANGIIGTVRKFIPYGDATENGYHLPYVIYRQLDKRKFQHIITKRDPRTGENTVQERWVKEFSLEVLPPLTQEELDKLAHAQLAAGSIDN